MHEFRGKFEEQWSVISDQLPAKAIAQNSRIKSHLK
jgi:hypothetical protein